MRQRSSKHWSRLNNDACEGLFVTSHGKQKIIQLNTFYFWMELRNSCRPPVRRRYRWYWSVISETHQWSPPVHSPPPAAEAAVISAPANWYCAVFKKSQNTVAHTHRITHSTNGVQISLSWNYNEVNKLIIARMNLSYLLRASYAPGTAASSNCIIINLQEYQNLSEFIC